MKRYYPLLIAFMSLVTWHAGARGRWSSVSQTPGAPSGLSSWGQALWYESNGNLFVSRDLGSTWKPAPVPGMHALVHYGASGTALAFNAQRSPDARSYVVRSDDNGMTWHFLQNPPCAAGQSPLPPAPVGTRTYALCVDGDRIVHLPYTDDDGRDRSSGGATVTLAALDENVQVSAFAKSILISAADGSQDLFQVTAAASRRVLGTLTRSHDVRQTSCDDVGYVYYSIRGHSYLIKSVDGGNLWEEIRINGTLPDMTNSSVGCSKSGLAIISRGGSLYSSGSGQTWTVVDNTGLPSDMALN